MINIFNFGFQDFRLLQKLKTYSMIKNNCCLEKYLYVVSNVKHRLALSKLRCSAHKLMIEKGRHIGIEENDRMCTKCNQKAVEFEYHFLLVCPYYRHIRINSLPMFYCHWPYLLS